MSDGIPNCDAEVFQNGKGICIFHAAAEPTEKWVKKVAADSGQKVDWHYSGGMVNMLYIGDYDKVLSAIEKLKEELFSSCNPELFKILPPNSLGLYRKSWEVHTGALAVDSISMAMDIKEKLHGK